jgi:hypothetical protein
LRFAFPADGEVCLNAHDKDTVGDGIIWIAIHRSRSGFPVGEIAVVGIVILNDGSIRRITQADRLDLV